MSLDLNYFRKEAFKKSRWGHNFPPHEILVKIINARKNAYKEVLKKFDEKFKDLFLQIPKFVDKNNPEEPYLDNPWFLCLDSFILYSMLGFYKSENYIEIGSGNSTKFARRSIKDNQLRTRLISIDPEPRAEIDQIADEIIRKPVEEVDVTFFDQLNAGDILFVDNSHRCFMNSDATVIFIDILPRLKPGVIVEFHDIFLPNDYPPHWGERYYSEQYLLAAYLLAEGKRFDILLPNCFINFDPELQNILNSSFLSDKRWGRKCQGGKYGGGSFWIVMNESKYMYK